MLLTMTIAGLLLSPTGEPLSSGSPAPAFQRPQTLNSPTRKEPEGPIDARDATSLVRRWGIQVESLRLVSAGYMLDFRYRVIDAQKAKPLFVRKTKPVMRDEATGMELAVPVPAKTGALRNSNDPKAGRSYFMFFGNPGRQIAAGASLSLTIGAFEVRGLRVQEDAAGAATPPPAEQTRAAGTAATPARPLRVLSPQPDVEDIRLVDHTGRTTTLRDAIGDGPALVNFIFTTCTTICPVMSTGFSQIQAGRPGDPVDVRLVSISINPSTDTAAVLRRYADKYQAGNRWRFLTGSADAVKAAQRAFEAYRGDRFSHEAATYVRTRGNAPWTVLEGLPSRDALLRALGRGGQP
jgi:protein SCO1/2